MTHARWLWVLASLLACADSRERGPEAAAGDDAGAPQRAGHGGAGADAAWSGGGGRTAGSGGGGRTAGSGGAGRSAGAGSSAGGSTGGGAAASSGGAGSIGAAAGQGQICDGSNDIRLGFNASGGFVAQSYQFTNPYGSWFAVVDGQCHFYVSESYMQGVLTGTLSPEDATALADDVRFSQIDAWNGHYGASCSDGGPVSLATQHAAISCVCGCDGAPAGAATAMGELYDWIDRLVTRGTPLAAAVSALAYEDDKRGPPQNVVAWPLSRPLADVSGLVVSSLAQNGPGARFDDAADAKALRELRSTHSASDTAAQSLIVKDAAGQYVLLVRDELPSSSAAAVAAFFSAAAAR
jgi:hypothetical protein